MQWSVAWILWQFLLFLHAAGYIIRESELWAILHILRFEAHRYNFHTVKLKKFLQRVKNQSELSCCSSGFSFLVLGVIYRRQQVFILKPILGREGYRDNYYLWQGKSAAKSYVALTCNPARYNVAVFVIFHGKSSGVLVFYWRLIPGSLMLCRRACLE